jgi:hypothetical protein
VNEAIIIGVLFSIIQAAFWLWVRTSIAKQTELIKNIGLLTQSLSDFKLATAKEYVSKSDLKDFIDRNDKIQSELKAYLMAIHDK